MRVLLRTVLYGVVTLMLAVVAGTPGLAETQAFSDPVGDVQFFDADAGTFQPADKAAVDITDVGVDHGDESKDDAREDGEGESVLHLVDWEWWWSLRAD